MEKKKANNIFPMVRLLLIQMVTNWRLVTQETHTKWLLHDVTFRS